MHALMKHIIPATIAAISFMAAQSQTSSALYMPVISPDIPSAVSLCGRNVDLDRVDMWERFDRELTSMIYTHGNTMLTIKRANRYFPVMAPILKKNGIPDDFLYLACIESYLNPRAYSPAKAAGIWQFTPATAKQYGLEVSDEVDERYNLEKATRAACVYLKKAYDKYGNWESVMAAYNGGTARISNALSDQNVRSAYDLYLTEETSRYPFRVMAMKTIMENPRQFGFRLKADQLYQPVRCKTEDVSGTVDSWAEWAAARGITYAQLREANPWIRAAKLTNKAGKTYRVNVPLPDALSRSRQEKHIYNKNWVAQ